MAVVHFATGRLTPLKSWAVPGGVSSLDVPDRIVGRGSGILRLTARTPAQPVNNQEDKTSESNWNEGEREPVTRKASGRAPGPPWPPPPVDYPGAQASPENPPHLHRTT